MNGDEDHHGAGAPVVQAEHKAAEGDLVLDVGGAGVGIRDRWRVIKRQEHAGDDHQDKERQTGAAEGVQPGDTARDPSIQDVAHHRAQPGPLVDVTTDPGLHTSTNTSSPRFCTRSLSSGRSAGP